MNLELIGILIRLRYRLLWAKTRTRNGKIALFFAGYFLLVMVGALFAAGGVGAGMTAIKSGKGSLLAGVLLTGVFAQAMLASVVLGFGMTTVFSETELRRYPLREWERRLTRHLIGIVDPFWLLFLLLDLGIALGLYLFGAGSFWLGLIAVLLLFVCNYAAARLLGALVERLMAKKGGSAILLVIVISLGVLPSLLQPLVHKNSPLLETIAQLWRATPAAAAGVAMTHMDMSGLSSLGVIFLWIGGFLAVLVFLERHPLKIAVVQATKITWGNPFDGIASLYGPKTGPLVAHWMRFYFRNNRFRTIYPLTIPLAAFLLYFFGRQKMGGSPFASALSAFLILGCIGTYQFAVNQFGYVGGGFRRFLLLPTEPAAAFRAGSLAFLTLSGALIPVGVVLWTIFSPTAFDVRALAMLTGASVTTLFFCHGVALWTSLLGPRRANFNMSLGNDLSFAGNIAVIGGMMTMLFLPRGLQAAFPGTITPQYWWIMVASAFAAAVFYFASLKSASTMFRGRREAMMVLLEGKA
jgi:hypothetical protein